MWQVALHAGHCQLAFQCCPLHYCNQISGHTHTKTCLSVQQFAGCTSSTLQTHGKLMH